MKIKFLPKAIAVALFLFLGKEAYMSEIVDAREAVSWAVYASSSSFNAVVKLKEIHEEEFHLHTANPESRATLKTYYFIVEKRLPAVSKSVSFDSKVKETKPDLSSRGIANPKTAKTGELIRVADLTGKAIDMDMEVGLGKIDPRPLIATGVQSLEVGKAYVLMSNRYSESLRIFDADPRSNFIEIDELHEIEKFLTESSRSDNSPD